MAKGDLYLARDGSEILPYAVFKRKPRWVPHNKSWVASRQDQVQYQPICYLTAADAERAFDTILSVGECQRVSFSMPDVPREQVA